MNIFGRYIVPIITTFFIIILSLGAPALASAQMQTTPGSYSSYGYGGCSFYPCQYQPYNPYQQNPYQQAYPYNYYNNQYSYYNQYPYMNSQYPYAYGYGNSYYGNSPYQMTGYCPSGYYLYSNLCWPNTQNTYYPNYIYPYAQY